MTIIGPLTPISEVSSTSVQLQLDKPQPNLNLFNLVLDVSLELFCCGGSLPVFTIFNLFNQLFNGCAAFPDEDEDDEDEEDFEDDDEWDD